MPSLIDMIRNAQRPQGFKGRPLDEGALLERKYALTPETVEMIDRAADLAGVAKSDVVEYCIRQMLSAIPLADEAPTAPKTPPCVAHADEPGDEIDDLINDI